MVLVLAQQDKQVHAMIRHAQGHIWECDLGVVGDEEGEAGSVGDKVLQGGQGYRQAIMGASAPP